MKTLTWLFVSAVFAGFSISAYAEEDGEEKKKPARPKTNANYRKPMYRKATTIKNPYAITSRRQVADKEATAAFNEFRKKCNSLNKSKDFSSIPGAVDEFLSSQSKLTTDQKSMAISYKVRAYMSEKEYQQAIDTAREAMKMKCDNSAYHAADAIRSARNMKDLELAQKVLVEFQKSGNYANGAFYGAAADLSFDLKNDSDAFEYLKNYGKQPRLSDWDKIAIFNGFGRYYKNRKRYDIAIPQYKAVLELPRVNANVKDNSELQIAYCYLQWGKKAEAIDTFRKLSNSRNGWVKNTARRELQKLTKKAAPKKNVRRRK